MNPFHNHPHNHLASMTQFTSSGTPPPNFMAPLGLQHPQNQHHNNVQQQNTSSNGSNSLNQSQSSQPQFLQPQTQAVVAAAASFYARSSAAAVVAGSDTFNRRQLMQNSNIASPSNNSNQAPANTWKGNYLMENFKFEANPNLFGGIEDSLFARAEALADISKASHMVKQQDNLYMAAAAAAHPSTIGNHHHLHQMTRHTFENGVGNVSGVGGNVSGVGIVPNSNNDNSLLNLNLNHHHHHLQAANSITDSNNNPFYSAFYTTHHHHPSLSPSSSSNQLVQQQLSNHHQHHHSAAAIAAAAAIHQTEIDIDPRELEAFAEKFKQRRIKLGVTQADVGQQLSKLKLPGVGSLSQSTICRFESLTLSHNNMIALKPVLQSWLEQAEAEARNKRKSDETLSTSSATNSSIASSNSMGANMANANTNAQNPQIMMNMNGGGMGQGNHAANGGHAMAISSSNSSSSNMHSGGSNCSSSLERKRKRTSIAAPEKRSLEAFFSMQPRPSGEKIAQIAEKLDLKKNVVRVWFCNQRQKQKRMKFAATQETS